MAEMKFNCPSCGQLIACDELWIGQEIQCPICGGSLSVPTQQAAAAPVAHSPLVPRPPSGAQSRLSIGQARHQAATAPPQSPRPNVHIMGAKKGKSAATKFAVWGIILAALGAGVYFGWPHIKAYQDKLNSKRRTEEANSDGGQVGHIADLNSVLDATDPSRGGPRIPSDTGRSPRPESPRPTGGSKIPPPAVAGGQISAGAETNLPVVPAAYSIDVAKASIPQGRVNGKISGANFVADNVRLDPVAGSYLLRLTQGQITAPDAQFLIYLRLKAGEKLAGHTWSIPAETKGAPTVSKRWKSDPKYAPKTQNYSTGYALKLELGEIKEGQVTGKIYIALPDPEQSFAAGVFTAQTTVTTTGETPAATAAGTPTVAPVTTPGQSPAEKAAFDKRYGIGTKK